MSPVNQWDQRVVGTRNLAATAATIAVVGLGVAAEPAFAAESGVHAMSRQEANGLTYTRGEVKDQIEPEAVAYYSKEFGVSRKEAIERLTTQGVAPNLQAPLGKRLGDDLAGVFFDNETGEWVVQVADKDSSAAADDVLDRLGLEAHSRLDWVGYTGSDVERTQQELGKLLMRELGEYTELGQLGVGAESLDLSLPDTLGSDARSRVDAVIKQVGSGQPGPPVEVRYVDPALLAPDPTYACSFPNCEVMTAGVRISPSGCTAAFKGGPAHESVSAGGIHWYTAGHCVPEGPPSASGLYNYSSGNWGFCSQSPSGGCTPTTGGTYAAEYFNSVGDAGLLAANSAGTGQPNIAIWKNNQTNYRPIRGWYTANAPVGTAACMSGVASGSNCGTVVNNNYTTPGAYKGMLKIEGGAFCPIPGDSGSPVTGPNDVAMGIVSRAVLGMGCGPGVYGVVEPIHRPVHILGSEPIVTP